MKNKKLFIILILVLIVLLISSVCTVVGIRKYSEKQNMQEDNTKQEFVLNTENKYLLRTNDEFMTMQNDGGSHVDTYYEIDLDEKISTKKQDRYKGFEGWVYQGKVINEKTLSNEEVTKLKDIFNEIIESKDSIVGDKLDYSYYTLSTKDYKEIKIYDKQVKQDILDIIE